MKIRRAAATAACIALAVGAVRALPVDSRAPAASVRMPAQVHHGLLVTFDEPVRNVTTANVRLRGEASGPVAGALSCSAGALGVPCATGPVEQVLLRPDRPLIAGERYLASVNASPEGRVTDVAGNPVRRTVAEGRTSVSVDDRVPAMAGRWRMVRSSAAVGGSYVEERAAGATARITLQGTSVVWHTKAGPREGLARVEVDGRTVATVDNYEPKARFLMRSFGPFAPGAHAVKVTVLGRRSAASSGTWIASDGWSAGGEKAAGEAFGWGAIGSRAAYASRYVRSDARGSSISLVFRGRAIDLYTVKGPREGRAAVYVDGVRRAVVDNYASSTRIQRRTYGGLRDAVHTLTIRVLGTKHARARGTGVAVDRAVVRTYSLSPYRGLGAWVDLWDAGLDPAAGIRTMAQNGVRTLYLQTGRWNSTSDIVDPDWVGEWLEEAHRRDISVVGWYLPAYDQHLDDDVRRTLAIARFRSAAGHRFDGLAVDIEYKGETESLSEFNEGITEHLRRVYAALDDGYPLAAIVPSPEGMAISPSSWRGFPWASVGRYARVVMPMAYWSYRTTCSRDPNHCPERYTERNVSKAARYTGLPVHVIGGVGDNTTSNEVAEFVRGALDARAYGASFYDFRTTAASYWRSLRTLAG